LAVEVSAITTPANRLDADTNKNTTEATIEFNHKRLIRRNLCVDNAWRFKFSVATKFALSGIGALCWQCNYSYET
jgi:hypothetical protein